MNFLSNALIGSALRSFKQSKNMDTTKLMNVSLDLYDNTCCSQHTRKHAPYSNDFSADISITLCISQHYFWFTVVCNILYSVIVGLMLPNIYLILDYNTTWYNDVVNSFVMKVNYLSLKSNFFLT